MNKAASNFPICVHLLDPLVYITPLYNSATSRYVSRLLRANVRINCYCYQRFLDRAEIALRLPIKNWNTINIDIRLSSTAPEFHRRTITTTNGGYNEIDMGISPEFHRRTITTTNGGYDAHQVKLRNRSQSKRFIHSTTFTDLSNHCFPLISKCSTTSHGIFASQIPNLHFANIWTLVQIWTLSKYSGEYFDPLLKIKTF